MAKEKTEERAVVTYKPELGDVVKLSPGIVRNMLTSGGQPPTDQEVLLFISTAKHLRLNPFLREIYLIKYSPKYPAAIVIGKDAYHRQAVANPDYDGHEAGIIVESTKGAEIVTERRIGTFKRSDETLLGGWAKVYRKNWHHPIEIEVSLEEYIQTKQDGTPNAMWSKKESTMICKVAKVQAWREAFPGILQNLRDEAEIDYSKLPDAPQTESVTHYHVEGLGEEEKPPEKTPEYIELENKILAHVNDPDFMGHVTIDKKDNDLDFYKKTIPEILKKKIHSMEKLNVFYEEAGRMLMVAQERANQTGEQQEIAGT
jgi:phage recombination protein Bet